MPAEWESHRATWLVWPHNRADWEVKTAAVEWCYAEIVRHLTDGERVAIVVQNHRVERRARRTLERSGVDLASVDVYRFRTFVSSTKITSGSVPGRDNRLGV